MSGNTKLDLVEKVARAMHRSEDNWFRSTFGEDRLLWKDADDANKEMWRRLARAALRASGVKS